MKTLTQARVEAICADIEYKPTSSFVVQNRGEVTLFNYREYVPCRVTNEIIAHSGRKWYISPHATDEEIVRTIRKAILMFEEHEINERLRYKGELVLNPHPEGPRPDRRKV